MTEEIWVSIDDLKRIFRKYRARIFRFALTTACLLCAFLLTRTPQYEAEAVFKLGSGKVEQSYDLKNIFQTLVSKGGESSAQSIFASAPVMRRTVEELGLQAKVQARSRFAQWLWNAVRNVKAEAALPLADEEAFQFQDVRYDGEKTKTFALRLKEPGLFEILGERSVRVFRLEEPVQIEGVSFTAAAAAPLKIGKAYTLAISPWKTAVEQAKKAFAVTPSKSDSHILTLKFTGPGRLLSARFLNAAMKNYQQFLQEEAAAIADSQLQYLDGRQKVLQERLDQTLQDHVAYLQEHLGERGFVGIHQELETLAHPQEMYNSKLFNIEFDLAHFSPMEYAKENQNVNGLREKLSTLDLEEKKIAKAQHTRLSAEIEQASLLLDQVESGRAFEARPHLFAPLVSRLEEAKASLESAPEGEKIEKERLAAAAKTALAEHLRDFIHALNLKQKAAEENSLYAKTLDSDFRGLDLETAKSLNVQYHGQLDSLHLALKQLLYLRDQIRDPAFDLGSMVNTPLDPITQQLVQKAADLEVQLHDDQHRSQREHQRMRDALGIQKKYIAAHISQTLDLHKIRIELTREKIAMLQAVTADLLQTEKKLVEEKLQGLKGQMAHLPEKWRIENLLKIKKEMTESMVEGLSQITESKIINRHLYNVESRPLDPALAPFAPKPPRIFLLAAAAALTAAAAAYFFFLLQNLLRGLAPSVEHLRRLGQTAYGPISERAAASFSELFDHDRETVRRIAESLIKGPKNTAAALMLGQYCDYSRPLTELLAMRGRSAAVLDCNFDRIVPEDEVPGLWQYVNGQTAEIPIRAGKIFAGAATRLATELFQKPEFSSLIAKLKTEYDYVLLCSRAPLGSTEASALQQVSDTAIVSYGDELCSDLLLWSRQKENRPVMFISNEAF